MQSFRIAMAMGRARGASGSRSTTIGDTLLRYSCSDLSLLAKLVQSIFTSEKHMYIHIYVYVCIHIYSHFFAPGSLLEPPGSTERKKNEDRRKRKLSGGGVGNVEGGGEGRQSPSSSSFSPHLSTFICRAIVLCLFNTSTV